VANLSDIANLGTTPIPGESPTGASVRYEPEYEKIQLEIEKLQSVSQVPVHWREVVELATTILSQKSKDLLITAYLAGALLQENGYPGLTAGLGVFKDILSTFWDKLFPPIEKMRGREGAVRWLDERGGKVVKENPAASESDREPLTACLAALEALNATLAEKFTESALSLAELSEALQEKLNSIPAAYVPPAGGGAPSGEAGVIDMSPPAPAADVIDSLDKVREVTFKAVAWLRQNNPADPLPFHLERSVLWGEVVEAPEHKDGQTAVAGGDAALLESWETGLKKKEYQRVLDEAEARLPADRLWLDPNLFAVRALEGLGTGFDAARRAVGDEVGALVRRVPELTTCKFEGGLPFAGEATRQWIQNELLGPPAPSADGTSERLDETMKEARKLATRSKLPAATALVQKEMQAVPPGRTKFLWRLNLAKLCAESGRHILAVPQLEALDEEAQRGALEQWEPELAVDVVKVLWQCYSSLSKSNESLTEKAARAYARLCRLDLTAAMALDGKK